MVPDDVAAYGAELVAAIRDVLGPQLVGASFVGSVALGGYVPGRSDIDVVVVAHGPVGAGQKDELVARLSHPVIPCPARGLELVLYDRAAVEVAQPGAAFELNLNSGPGMATHVGLDPSLEPRFWFVLDRSIAQRSGVAIEGPPPSALFAPMPRRWILDALAESLSWARTRGEADGSAVLNACRAWRCADDGILGSKDHGGAWAQHRWPDAALIHAALRSRHAAPVPLPADRVRALLEHVATVILLDA